jgi:cell division protein FtsZ
MSDNYESSPYSVKIKVIGVGSGGINAVVGMISKLEGVEFWAIDTDVTNAIDRTPMNITGGSDMPLCSNKIGVADTADKVYEFVDPNADIIFGAVVDPNMDEKIQVSVIATGFAKSSNQIE